MVKCFCSEFPMSGMIWGKHESSQEEFSGWGKCTEESWRDLVKELGREMGRNRKQKGSNE